jgi:methylphosphotriester-DNA--protein-cysteine methyltransferase
MKKTVLLVVVLFCVIAVVFAAGRDTVVYITKTGEKYHREYCSSLKKSKIDISLGEAVRKGYDPCKQCKPPILDLDEEE